MTVNNYDEDGTQASAAASLASLEDVTVPQQLDFDDLNGSSLLRLTEFGGREVAVTEEAQVWWDRAAALVAALDDDDDDDDFALTCATSSLVNQDDDDDDFALTCATSSLVNQDDDDDPAYSARDAEIDDDVANDEVEVVGADGTMSGITAEAATGWLIVAVDDDRCSPRAGFERASSSSSMDALHEVFWARSFAEIAGFVAEPVRPRQMCETKLWWEVLANLAVVIEDVTDVPAARISPQSRFTEDLGVDSINAIEIGLHIEEVYRVRVPDEVLPSLHTVGEAVNYIAGQCWGTGPVMDAATNLSPDAATPAPDLPAAAAPTAAPTAALGRSARRRKAF